MAGLLEGSLGIFEEGEEGNGSALVFSQLLVLVFSQLLVLERWKEKAKLLVFIQRNWGFEMLAQGMTGQ